MMRRCLEVCNILPVILLILFCSAPDPLKCIAFGPGLERAEVGYDAEFTVQLRNASGKDIPTGGEVLDIQIKVRENNHLYQYSFQVKAPLNSSPVKAEIHDNGNGTYLVKYNAKAHGKHLINVNVRNKPIQNSPYSVNAERLGMSLAHDMCPTHSC
jgi:hypothetical protein